MRNEINFSLEISQDDCSRIVRIIESKNDNFVHLVHEAGLDPRRDLIGCDLSNVDFSDSDLRGFNLSYCDLRGAIGHNVTFDQTTIFNGADIESSVFSYAALLDPFQDEFQEQAYQRLKGEYWPKLCNWIGDNVRAGFPGDAKRMAIRLFFDANDLTVKTDLLLRIRRLFQSTDDFKAFLVNVILRKPGDFRAVQAAIQTSSGIIESDYFLFRTLLSFVRQADETTATSVLSQLIGSRFFGRHIESIGEILTHSRDGRIRAQYIRRINSIFRYGQDSHLQTEGGRYLDFTRPASLEEIQMILKNISLRKINRAVRENQSVRPHILPQSLTVQRNSQIALDIIEGEATVLLNVLKKFRNHGIDFLGKGSLDEIRAKIVSGVHESLAYQ